MSQNRSKGGRQGSSSRSKASRPVGQQSSAGSYRPVVKNTVGVSGRSQSSFRTRVDDALPPFSVRRYVAIWAVGMLVLAGVLVTLLRVGGGTTSPAAGALATPNSVAQQPTVARQAVVTPQTGATGSTPAAQTAATSVSGIVVSPAATIAGASAATPATSSGTPQAGGSSSSSAGDKYFVIDTAKGRIVAKLHTEAAAGVSKTIANFVQKATAGYFNGRNFHRVEAWVIQGGDPKGDGTGGGTMPSEYNQLPFNPGALGVARGQDPALNNDSQFFIVKTDANFLNGQYTNFGQVTSGMDVVQNIAIGDKITNITVQDHP